ncbi:hypothetical protein Plhal304r1_c030g0098051 [Plasmopara halstedii]
MICLSGFIISKVLTEKYIECFLLPFRHSKRNGEHRQHLLKSHLHTITSAH